MSPSAIEQVLIVDERHQADAVLAASITMAPMRPPAGLFVRAIGVTACSVLALAVNCDRNSTQTGGPTPLSVSFSITPDEPLIVGVTTSTFAASGGGTSFLWSFGDGQSASGASVTHRYDTLPPSGLTVFAANVTASDGFGHVGGASRGVVVMSVTGCWTVNGSAEVHQLTQNGPSLSGTIVTPSGARFAVTDGVVTQPRHLFYKRSDGDRSWDLDVNPAAPTHLTGKEHHTSGNDSTVDFLFTSQSCPQI